MDLGRENVACVLPPLLQMLHVSARNLMFRDRHSMSETKNVSVADIELCFCNSDGSFSGSDLFLSRTFFIYFDTFLEIYNASLGCLGHLRMKIELFSEEIKLIKKTYIPEPGIELEPFA